MTPELSTVSDGLAQRAIPERYLTSGPYRPNARDVKSELEAKTRSLIRLAQLLQRRYGANADRSFVMMMADIRHVCPELSDAMVTQPIRPFR